MSNNSKIGVTFRPKWYRAISQSWETADANLCACATITLHKDEEHWRTYTDKVLSDNRAFVQQTKIIPLSYDHPNAPAQETRVPYSIVLMLERLNGNVKFYDEEYVTLIIIANVRYIVDIGTFKKHENIFRKEYDFLAARR